MQINTCEFHIASNQLGIRIIHIWIKRDPPVLTTALPVNLPFYATGCQAPSLSLTRTVQTPEPLDTLTKADVAFFNSKEFISLSLASKTTWRHKFGHNSQKREQWGYIFLFKYKFNIKQTTSKQQLKTTTAHNSQKHQETKGLQPCGFSAENTCLRQKMCSKITC